MPFKMKDIITIYMGTFLVQKIPDRSICRLFYAFMDEKPRNFGLAISTALHMFSFLAVVDTLPGLNLPGDIVWHKLHHRFHPCLFFRSASRSKLGPSSPPPQHGSGERALFHPVSRLLPSPNRALLLNLRSVRTIRLLGSDSTWGRSTAAEIHFECLAPIAQSTFHRCGLCTARIHL